MVSCGVIDSGRFSLVYMLLIASNLSPLVFEMVLLARHLADVSCFIGPSVPSGICCMEIHTEIV